MFREALQLRGLPSLLGFDAGCFTFEAAQVVDAAATYFTFSNNLYTFNVGGVYGEDALYADTVGNLADGEGGVGGTFTVTENCTLENLNAFFFTFDNAQVYLYSVACLECRHINAHVFALDLGNYVHVATPYINSFAAPEGGSLPGVSQQPVNRYRHRASY